MRCCDTQVAALEMSKTNSTAVVSGFSLFGHTAATRTIPNLWIQGMK